MKNNLSRLIPSIQREFRKAESRRERKKADETLLGSEEKYRALLEYASDAIMIADFDGNLLELNKKTEELLGYTREELPGINLSQVHPKEELEKALRAFREMVEGKTNSFVDTKVLRKDGEIIPVDITGAVIEYGGKRVVQGICRDITKQKQAEKALKESEHKYRSIFENAVEGIFQGAPEGHFITVNPAMAHMHGFASPEEMVAGITNIGKQLYINPEDRERYRTMLEEKGAVNSFEAQVYRKDGNTTWTSTNARAVKNSAGNISRFEGTVEDITSHKLAEEDLKQTLEKIIGW